MNDSTSHGEAAVGPQETFNDVEAVITAPFQHKAVQRPLAAGRQRWDTEVAQVEVRGNQAADRRLVAANYVAERFPDCLSVLSVYSSRERGPSGHLVWNVEWVATWTDDE